MILFRPKRHGAGLDAGLVLRDDQPSLADPPRELSMGGRVVAVDAAAEHCDRRSASLESSAVSLTVHPTSHAAHDDEARRGKLA